MSLFLILLFVAASFPFEVVASDPCVQTILDLESAFLSNGENLQSLMRAFYPSNNFPALWVKVIYCTNDSVSNENHTFYWSSSPVLVYLHPLILEEMSLLFFNDDYTHSVSRLTIPAFCEGIDDKERVHILNDATVWVCSYEIIYTQLHMHTCMLEHCMAWI